MPRPRCCRRVAGSPPCTLYKPAGIPASALEAVTVTVDEFEAMRLADLLGMYQEDAARRMNVSRQTFGRIIESARKKVAQALVEAKALKIEGGDFQMTTTRAYSFYNPNAEEPGDRDAAHSAKARSFQCSDCRHKWEVPFGTGRPAACPRCKSRNFHRAEQERGPAGKGQRRCGHAPHKA